MSASTTVVSIRSSGPQQLVVAQLAEQGLVELVDDPRAAATDELDQGGGVRDGLVQRDAAEPAPRDRVGDLAAQALVAELVAVLQVQQAHQGSDRDRGTAQPGGEVGAPRGDEAFVVEVGVDAGELVGQAPGLKGEPVVPGSDRWGGNAKHHKHPEAPSNAILPGHHHCPAASPLLKAYDRLHFLRSR
jgi:hypothetical protein